MFEVGTFVITRDDTVGWVGDLDVPYGIMRGTLLFVISEVKNILGHPTHERWYEVLIVNDAMDGTIIVPGNMLSPA